MKNITLLDYKVITILVISCMCLLSCSEESLDQISSEVATSESILLPTSTLEWDESYHPNDIQARSSPNNQSHEMAVTNTNLYIGGVYSAASIQNLTFAWISNV